MSGHLSLRIMSVLKQRVKFCSDCLNMLGSKVEMVCLGKKTKNYGLGYLEFFLNTAL